jgi:hypothetical protein
MNEEEKNILMKKLEEEFEELLTNGGDGKNFLYIPYTMLTPKVKKHLDVILLEEAYKSVISENFDPQDFIVYKDNILTIRLHEFDQKAELLERLVSYFSEKEEYEKCTQLVKIKKQYNL